MIPPVGGIPPLATALACHMSEWAGVISPSARVLLESAVQALCVAAMEGHVCVSLRDICLDGQPVRDARDLLFSCNLVGTPEAPANNPLILDDADYLYLHRYFRYGQLLARRLVALRADGEMPPRTEAEAVLTRFFGVAGEKDEADWQRIAAALALCRRLTVISGGPGTGKTTTLTRLLACVLCLAPDTRIALAAPTGKAAMRMTEAIQSGVLAMADIIPPSLRARMPDKAGTIHRLLRFSPLSGEYYYQQDNPLPIDMLVVDEASMLDLALTAHLFSALPAHARLVLLGDKDQLSSVEAGSVFSELSENPALSAGVIQILSDITGVAPKKIAPPIVENDTGITDNVIWFTRQFRFSSDSGIARLAKAISEGSAESAVAILAQPGDASVTLREETGGISPDVTQRIQEGYAAYIEALQTDDRDKERIFGAFNRFRVLCATHEGARGVSACNQLMEREVCRHLGIPLATGRNWYKGRAVMVQRNHYALELFNGDTGITLPDERGRLMVWFPAAGGQFRAIAPVRLPEYLPAFAMTVHKSQGAEFDTLLVLLPGQKSRVMTRELLYTAITRARERVCLVADRDTLARSIQKTVQHRSGLANRLAEEYRNGGDIEARRDI
ncbi:MAG: exodeoxyribonuclease V subunit alpha [Burkholderiaceae bacterium]|jgi:exodeoxyribonuclease V alpha subunit|nr:exodeoxyribonuclease V subunit alpha [Burkholderiaceae bacterium]